MSRNPDVGPADTAELLFEARAIAHAIAGPSDLLAHGVFGPLTEEQQSQVEGIRDNALRLVSALNSLSLAS